MHSSHTTPTPITSLQRRDALVLLLITGLTLAFAARRLLLLLPARDAGTFLYVGWRMTQGEMPYVDVWDHKPPLIYMLNALGWLLTPGHHLGIQLLEIGCVVVGFGLFYAVLKRAFGFWPALFGVVAPLLLMVEWLVFILGYHSGFALPLAAGILYLLAHGNLTRWRALTIGVLSGLLFLLKLNFIGLPLAIGAYLLFTRLSRRQLAQLAKELAWCIIGGLSVLGLFALYFIVNGAFAALWDAVITYNLAYTSSGRTLDALGHALDGWLTLFGNSYLFWLSIVGVLLAFAGLQRSKTHLPTIVAVALLALPIEFALLALAERSYPHYYVIVLPTLAVLAAYALARLQGVAQRITHPGRWPVVPLILVGLLGVHTLGNLQTAFANWDVRMATHEQQARLINTIQTQVPPDGYLYIWGADSGINAISQRPAPTRYVYAYPLFTVGYQSETKVQALLQDLQAHPPALLIDAAARVTAVPMLTLDPNSGQNLIDNPYYAIPPGYAELWGHLHAHYTPIEGLLPPAFTAYAPR